MTFDDAFTALIGNEGGYSNDPNDPGAETMWGVSAAVARANGYAGAMRDLPLGTAKAIARTQYWNPAHCDDCPDGIRFDMLDMAYNSGAFKAVELLQRALGFSLTQTDGLWGMETHAAVVVADAGTLRLRLNAERLDFFAGLPTWADFGKGWARRIAANLRR